MLVLFIVGLLVVLVGLTCIIAGLKADVEYPGWTVGVGVTVLFVGAFVAYTSTWTTVDARSVAIVTSLNKYNDTIGPGFQHKAPWESTEEWTTRNQVIRFEGKGGGAERDNYFTESCITVRLGNQSNACVDTTITFHVTEASVKGLWEQHKTFEAARRDFVVPQAVSAAVRVFDGYNPLAGITEGATSVKTVGVGEWTTKLRPVVEQMYRARSVEVVDVQVTFIHYDEATTNRLRDIANELANTEIAKQKVKTAEEEAKASAARRAQSGADCASLMRDIAALGREYLEALPEGFNCGQPSGLVARAT